MLHTPLFALTAVLALGVTAPDVASPDTRPTAAFRAEHVAVREHLAHIDAMVIGLAGQSDAARRETAAHVVGALEAHIGTHAAWEEAHLYPAVDRRTIAGELPFTASMRHEHVIVGRWIKELATLSRASPIDAEAFARRAQRLLGLIEAHFEEEELVLLPVLDAATTREALERELGMTEGHTH